jgi:hypothetical protein
MNTGDPGLRPGLFSGRPSRDSIAVVDFYVDASSSKRLAVGFHVGGSLVVGVTTL